MKKIVTFLLIVSLLAVSSATLSSCGKGGDAVTLYVYNWGEYISDGSEGSLDVNAAFEEWYEATYGEKVKVNYSTFSSNEDMYAKISSGASNYDIIIPSDYMVGRMLEEGMLRKLDKANNIPNAQHIDTDALFQGEAPFYDPTNEYSVPYTYGTVGIIYNRTMLEELSPEWVAKIDAGEGSWDIMWDPTLEGNILQFNNSRDAFATAMFKLGYDVNTDNQAQWREALALLMTQKEIVQGYVMDEIYNKMENGSAVIAPYYAGDYLTMYANNEDLAFFYPKEGTNIFVDAMCIPATSQNPLIAERYINFMLSVDEEWGAPAIANAEYICYASPNTLVTENETYLEDMQEMHPDIDYVLYGADAYKTQFFENLPEEQLMLINELWEDLKIESSINVSIIVMAAVIAGGAVAAGIFFYVRRYRRKRYIDGLWQ